jgi:hypothetical protein
MFTYELVLKRMRTNIRFCKDSRGNRFRGLNETAGSDMKSYAAPAVNNRKLKIFVISFRSIIETAGLVSAVSLKPRDSIPRSH